MRSRAPGSSFYILGDRESHRPGRRGDKNRRLFSRLPSGISENILGSALDEPVGAGIYLGRMHVVGSLPEIQFVFDLGVYVGDDTLDAISCAL